MGVSLVSQADIETGGASREDAPPVRFISIAIGYAHIQARDRARSPAMMTVMGVAPAAMAADVPAPVQATVAMPAPMMAATVRMPVTALDLDGDRIRRQMLGEGGCGCRRAGGGDCEGCCCNPENSTCLQRLNSLNAIVVGTNGTSGIWFPRLAG